MVPDSDRTVVDFGAHLYPERAFPDFEQIVGSAIYDQIGAVFTEPDRSLQQLHAGGVDRAVFSMPYCVSVEDLDRVRQANDALRDLTREYEECYGLAALPVAAGGEVAAEEFERCLEDGLQGGVVETRTNGVELVDEELESVFDIAERTGAPLFVHPKIHDSLHPEVLDDQYRLNAIFGREVSLAESICKVIHEGVLDRYPDLNLVYHHQGGNVAAMMDRLHLQLDDGRWPNQDHVKSYEEFEAQLRERIYVDTSGFFGHAPALRRTLEVFPSTQVLFGTDHPAEARTKEEFRDVVDRTQEVCEEKGAEVVLGRNALNLMVNC